MRTRGAALHTLVGAYVMDAVTDKDRAAFERHLLTCEQCREDVRGLREAAAHLAAAAAVPPRPELRSPTLKAAERIRQLPPVVPGRAGRAARGAGLAGESAPAGRPWPRRRAPLGGQARGLRRRGARSDGGRAGRAHERDAGSAERGAAARERNCRGPRGARRHYADGAGQDRRHGDGRDVASDPDVGVHRQRPGQAARVQGL